MATVNLNRDEYAINDGNAGKVIIRDLADITGGRALDVSSWPDDTILSGHIIAHNTVTGEYFPLGVTSGAYNSLDTNEEYAGVLKVAVLKAKPFAAIMTVGEVNAAASPYPVTAAIKAGLPQIKFLY